MQLSRPVASATAKRAFRPAGVIRRNLRVSALLSFGKKTDQDAETGFYSYTVQDIDGKSVKMSSYKGKAVLVVNLASACGFTPQYSELQAIYDKYKSKGLVVAGFPCNQFGGQEPGSNRDIKAFAQKSYGVTFPLFSKVDVNGKNADPLFDWLKKEKGGFLTSDIKWNFSKFLVDKQGGVVGRYGSTTTPAQLEADIAKLL